MEKLRRLSFLIFVFASGYFVGLLYPAVFSEAFDATHAVWKKYAQPVAKDAAQAVSSEALKANRAVKEKIAQRQTQDCSSPKCKVPVIDLSR